MQATERTTPMGSVTPWLWFDMNGEDAARFYTALFPNSRIGEITHYGSANPGREGQAMTVSFELDGQPLVALNGGSSFRLNEAFSLMVSCKDQEEVDRYWDALTADGGEESDCGWLKDKYGLSWQIIPEALPRLLGDPDREKSQRVMAAMLKMKKIEVAELERAAEAV
jgi:predicted 3-demethylubiquinone-9 3-methyltransferase (glyoxalase superfamily)